MHGGISLILLRSWQPRKRSILLRHHRQGTTLQVALTPYAGYGCNDTLTAVLLDTLTVFANAGPDRLSCQNAPVQLGINPRQGFVYSWSPVTGLSNPNISNPIATPSVTTQYILTVTNAGGGCLTRDTVIVNAAVIDNSITLYRARHHLFSRSRKQPYWK
ncbi:MAG: hypothetical protein IPH68_15280 [Chitinophagaceae bacterium]|nr:hypothetical protein [Chitinophagaceae bacterium]